MSGEIDAPRVRLDLMSRPEAARLVRSMSNATGEALGFDPELLSDVNTAVAEACNNVILHAYDGTPGPFSVEMAASAEDIQIRICDQGCGIGPTVPDQDRLKVGLALMSALADRAEFISPPDGGTEVRLTFLQPAQRAPQEPESALDAPSNGHGVWSAPGRMRRLDDVVLTVSPVTLLGPILGRLGRTLAPSAGFSLARCYDVYLLSDALAAHAQHAAQASVISVSLGARGRQLEFALSPLRVGTSGLLEAGSSQGAAVALASLTEEVAVSPLDGGEMLRVSMRDRLRG